MYELGNSVRHPSVEDVGTVVAIGGILKLRDYLLA